MPVEVADSLCVTTQTQTVERMVERGKTTIAVQFWGAPVRAADVRNPAGSVATKRECGMPARNLQVPRRENRATVMVAVQTILLHMARYVCVGACKHLKQRRTCRLSIGHRLQRSTCDTMHSRLS